MAETGSDNAIAVTTRKYDGGLHLAWPARLLLADDDLILTYTPPGATLVHHTRGLCLPQDHACLSAFPRDRHWNAMLDFAPDGRWLGAYCNVALPPILAGDRLDWVDLDLDVLRSGDGPATLVDADEFAAHAIRYAYPAALVAATRAAANDLLALAGRGVAPFVCLSLAYATDAHQLHLRATATHDHGKQPNPGAPAAHGPFHAFVRRGLTSARRGCATEARPWGD